MKKLILFIFLLTASIFLISSPQIPNAHAVTLAKDGNGITQCPSPQTTCSVTITTTQTNDLIYVVCDTQSPSNTPDVQDNKGGTYFSRDVRSSSDALNIPAIYVFYRIWSGSGSITVTCENYKVGTRTDIQVIAISGADTTTVFDSTGPPSRPITWGDFLSPTQNATVTFSTTNANDFILFFWGSDSENGGTLSCSSDFTLINGVTTAKPIGAECFEIVSSTLVNRLVWGKYSKDGNMLIGVDAIKQAPANVVTQPIQCTEANGAIASVGSSLTIDTGPSTPVILQQTCDGSTTNITVNPSIILRASVGVDGSNLRSRLNVGGASATSTTMTTCGSGTCPIWSTTVYLQWLITDPQGLTITPTQVGSPGIATNIDVFNDYGGNLIVAATYTNTWTITYATWIYDITTTGVGIQLLGDQPITSINWQNGNPSAPYLTFTTTSTSSPPIANSRVRGFIPPITGFNLQNVYNNGIINPSATFSGNTIDETGITPHEWDLTLVSAGTASPNSSPNQPPSSGTGQNAPTSSGGGGITTLPIFQIQVTTTTATILGQPFVLVAPVYGDPGLIPLGIAVLVTSVAIIFLGAAFFSDRERKKREYDPQRHF